MIPSRDRRYRLKVLRDRSPGKDRRQAEYRRRQHVAGAEHKKRDHSRPLRFDPKHRASLLCHEALNCEVLRPLRRQHFQPRKRCSRSHSITSSARASSDCGTSSPSALAVLRLMTSSYLVGACTGRSAGFSPLRMRSI